MRAELAHERGGLLARQVAVARHVAGGELREEGARVVAHELEVVRLLEREPQDDELLVHRVRVRTLGLARLDVALHVLHRDPVDVEPA
ncbi:hypothetical protein [Anaeromyxobacter sp. SG64]|uniref:hypothetical protein n=1 Tax=Anaeromyxobacter sp. SG64 TaxID=2925409 RepID=UPI001F5767FC|nr:hypothetical protein [Anaeromyxobacter sp. SG64]